MVTDPRADTWYYTTAANPNDSSYLFEGSPANQMSLVPLAPLAGRQDCPACRGGDRNDSVVAVADTNGREVETPGTDVGDVDWDLAVTDLAGRPIRGAQVTRAIDNDDSNDAIIPPGRPFRLILSGVPAGQIARLTVTAMAGDWAATLPDLTLPHGVTATVDVDPRSGSVTVGATGAVTTDLTVATDNTLRSVKTTVGGVRLGAGRTLRMTRNRSGDEDVRVVGGEQRLSVAVERSDILADRTAHARTPILVPSGARLSIPVGSWTGWDPISATVTSRTAARPIPLVP